MWDNNNMSAVTNQGTNEIRKVPIDNVGNHHRNKIKLGHDDFIIFKFITKGKHKQSFSR